MKQGKGWVKISFYFLFIPFGFASFIPFWTVAKVLKRTHYWIVGMIYLFSAFSTLIVTTMLPGDSPIVLLVFCLNLFIWLEAIASGLKIRKELFNLKTSYVILNDQIELPKERNDYIFEMTMSINRQIHELYTETKDIPFQLQPIIFSILASCEEIVYHVEQFPEDYGQVRSFFTGYFTSFRQIVHSLKGLDLSEMNQSMHEDNLCKIDMQFKELLKCLIELKENRLKENINLLNNLMKQDNK